MDLTDVRSQIDEIDTHLLDLCRQYGETDGALAYRACAPCVG